MFPPIVRESIGIIFYPRTLCECARSVGDDAVYRGYACLETTLSFYWTTTIVVCVCTYRVSNGRNCVYGTFSAVNCLPDMRQGRKSKYCSAVALFNESPSHDAVPFLFMCCNLSVLFLSLGNQRGNSLITFLYFVLAHAASFVIFNWRPMPF